MTAISAKFIRAVRFFAAIRAKALFAEALLRCFFAFFLFCAVFFVEGVGFFVLVHDIEHGISFLRCSVFIIIYRMIYCVTRKYNAEQRKYATDYTEASNRNARQ